MATRQYPHPLPKDGIGESIADLADDTAKLVHLELELFKQEVTALLKRNAIALGMLAGAGLAAFLALIFLLVWVIEAVPDGWHAWVALGIFVVFVAATVGLALFGKSRIKIALPEASIQSMKESLEWAKQQIKPAPR
jgi:hypothetical protein